MRRCFLAFIGGDEEGGDADADGGVLYVLNEAVGQSSTLDICDSYVIMQLSFFRFH